MNQDDLLKDVKWSDPSLWAVMAGNFISIVMAVVQGWDLNEVLWIYWFQSVLIGLINFFRILTLRDFSTEGLKSNGRPVPETPQAKRGAAFFFLFHYGFFHLVYAIFLSQEMPLGSFDRDTVFFILLCVAGFAGAHGFSFAHNNQRDFRDEKPNLGHILFYPYIRILPMHMTIIFGAVVTAFTHGAAVMLVIFMVMKTAADAGMHVMEHRMFRE